MSRASRTGHPRLRRPRGHAVVAPGIYVWENTPPDLAWARELAAFAWTLTGSQGRRGNGGRPRPGPSAGPARFLSPPE